MQGLRTQASAETVASYAPTLYRFIARLVGQDADAEDVLQQTFAAAIGNLARFEGSEANLRSWVFTIAYRAAMDNLRGRRRVVPLDEIEIEAPAEPIDLETPPAELRRAFKALEPGDQQILTLKYQDDFSNGEISKVLGVTSNHAGVLLYRAKQNLRKAMR
jgi:RNA polymerase sigma-70 factor (ECF subfamily)